MSSSSNSSSQNSQSTASLKARREALGLTRAELAVKARCSITTLYYIETGVTRRGINLDKISNVLTEMEAAA